MHIIHAPGLAALNLLMWCCIKSCKEPQQSLFDVAQHDVDVLKLGQVYLSPRTIMTAVDAKPGNKQ